MARQVASDLGAELRLDLFSYRSDRLRRFGLGHFRISGTSASWIDVFRLCPLMATGRLAPRPVYERAWNFWSRFGIKPRCRSRVGELGNDKLFHGRVLAERQTTFDAEAATCPDDHLIVGNWPNERYFVRIRRELLGELVLRQPPSRRDQEILDRMENEDSVAVHVRRGDKVGNSTFKATSAEYCIKAMKLAGARVRNPRFYIFSDDPGWVAAEIGVASNTVIVDHHRGDEVHEDFRLMRACKHQIVASSSLSWWAAWLNDNPGKVVISPPASHWVQRAGCDTSQILPSEWLIVEAAAD